MISIWPKFYPTTEHYRELASIGGMYTRNVDMGARDWVGPGYANSFYDPYGKGTLGFAFAQRFGANSPIPVDSGAKATERPVRADLFTTDKKGRRLKKCSEHYVKFVTEAWFSVTYIVQAGQMREITEDVVREMSARKYSSA